MKPIYEVIDPNPGSSFYVSHCNSTKCNSRLDWHIHNEFEIVYIEKGCGTRHIGSHFSRYRDGILIAVGSGIPHSTFCNSDFEKNDEVVVQIPQEICEHPFLNLVEFKHIHSLLQITNAIIFEGETKRKIAQILIQLSKANSTKRLLLLLEILNYMSRSKHKTHLDIGSVSTDINANDYNRISKIFNWISDNYQRKIDLLEISSYTGLTTNSFCRFFKNITGKSFTNYLNEFRINKSCELMEVDNNTITDIMILCGFNDLTYYCKTFKKIKGVSPGNYRKDLRQWK